MKVSNVRQLLKRGWYFSELPGYRSHPSKFRTYSLFPYDELPAIEEELTDFSWLLRDHMKDQSLLDGMYPDGSKPDLSKLAELQNSINISFPSSFIDFINSDDLKGRVRSCTDCYLDLGDCLVHTSGVEKGYLTHFMSDSQWILHWYLYLDESGDHCVLVSEAGFGFQHIDMDSPRKFDRDGLFQLNQKQIWLCAESFQEFIYRFWIENEIYFSLTVDPKPLSDLQKKYVGYSEKD
jgi:hypothetical protein